MPDPNPPLDSILLQQLNANDAKLAADVKDFWGIILAIGIGLLIVLAVASVILAVYRFSERWRRKPPAPKSIIPPRPDGR
jgi:hypothetical protein